jgi:AraC-like DNA-binding protein
MRLAYHHRGTRLICESIERDNCCVKRRIEVALDVGYTNPSHFAQIFRRETGLTPSKYRRQR